MDDAFVGILLVLLLTWFFALPIYVFITGRDRFRRLERKVKALETTIAGHAVTPAVTQQDQAEPAAEAGPRPAGPTDAPTDASTDVPRDVPAIALRPARRPPLEFDIIKRPTPPPPARPAPRGVEESIASRWLLWIGGLALTLGGAFLVIFLAEQNLMSPLMRVLLGLSAGALLVAAGEWTLRRSGRSNVPPALSGAGIFTMFASVYAAFQLYAMLPPTVAFGLLAVIAVTAVGLSLRQGPFLAVLGLLGGFGTPLLVATDQPSAAALFSYIFLLTAGGLAVVRYQAWWWLGWLSLASAALWPFLWFASLSVDTPVLGVYAVALLALFAGVRHDAAGIDEAALPRWYRFWRLPQADLLVCAAAAAAALIIFALVQLDDFGLAAIATLIGFCALSLAIARWRPILDSLAALAAGLAIALFASWPLLGVLTDDYTVRLGQGRAFWAYALPAVPPELTRFATTGAILALIFGAGGYAALWRAKRPGVWAWLSASVPLVLLALAFWRIKAFQVDIAWAAVAFGLAALNLWATERLLRNAAKPALKPAAGGYATGVAAALCLALAMALTQAWLTVALAVLLPSIAWIAKRLELPDLRRLGLVLAATVSVRLLVNPNTLGYASEATLGAHWLAYGYGLPALAFFVAARLFRSVRDDLLVTVLQAGALAFAVLMLTLEGRQIVGAPPLDFRQFGLAEQAIQTVIWATIGLLLYRRAATLDSAVVRWGWRLLTGLAVGQLVVGHLLVSNPLWSMTEVGSTPIFNLVLLAYGAPAVLAGLFAWTAGQRGDARLARVGVILLVGLAIATVSLEIRQAFHGTNISWTAATGAAELYAYSAAWLVCTGVLLAIGIARQSPAIRYASLALVMLTVVKVFLVDMATLTGIWRPLSFLGLGLALIAVGYFYRRFVFPPNATVTAGGLPE